MANEEVAESKVLIDAAESLLEVVECNWETTLVTLDFPGDLSEDEVGCRDKDRLNVVNPAVDLGF